MGIEPTPSAWKAEVLPLNYTRLRRSARSAGRAAYLVEGGGFEPPKAEPSDLQSDPFDRSGTPPKRKLRIVGDAGLTVNGSDTRLLCRLQTQSRAFRNSEYSLASGVPGSGSQL